LTKIDTNDPAQREAIEVLLFKAVMCSDGDQYEEGTYKRNDDAYKAFVEAVYLCARLKLQGLCNFEYDAFDTPYTLHCIQLQWNVTELLELQATEVAEILTRTETLVLDNSDPFEWQLSSVLYTET